MIPAPTYPLLFTDPYLTSKEWECELWGMGRDMVYHPAEGHAPNWFWRWMQYLCFGNRWVRINK